VLDGCLVKNGVAAGTQKPWLLWNPFSRDNEQNHGSALKAQATCGDGVLGRLPDTHCQTGTGYRLNLRCLLRGL
jgi:hypothetical protein